MTPDVIWGNQLRVDTYIVTKPTINDNDNENGNDYEKVFIVKKSSANKIDKCPNISFNHFI